MAASPAVTPAAGSTTSMADLLAKALPALVPVVAALGKALLSRGRSDARGRDSGLPQLSEHRLVQLQRPVEIPRRWHPVFVVLKFVCYGLGLLATMFITLAAGWNLKTRLDVPADAALVILGLMCGVFFSVSLLNSWPNRSRRRPEQVDATLRVTGDRAWIAWASESAVRRANATPRLLDATDEQRGWAVGVSGEAGDFLGGRIVLVVSYSSAGADTWDVTIVSDATRWRTRYTWGRNYRALWRACDWLERDARAATPQSSVKRPRSGRTWRTRSAGSIEGAAVPAP